ncbi:MAG: RCC1 domain-containing protein [Streptosporangiaceae bacterium]
MTIAGAGLCVGGMTAVLAGGIASAQVSPGAGAGGSDSSGGTVEHWGHGVVTPSAEDLPAPVAEVGSNNGAEYALLTNGTLYAWGFGAHGELGDGSTSDSSTPVQVKFPAGVKITSVPIDAMPWDTAFAIDTTGHAWGWGANAGGELCLGNIQSYDTPVEITRFSKVTAMAGAAQHATYDAGGTLYSCGVNYDGQLGDGGTKPSHVPVKVKGLSGASVTALVTGFANVGALLSSGQYYDWGWDGAGQLGDGTVGKTSDVPVKVTLPAAVTQVVQGGNGLNDGQSMVLLSNGSVYAWGANGAGQLGTGNLSSKSSPVRISPPSGVTYEALASAGDTSLAVSATGNVYAWGSNSAGEFGNGTKTNSKTPVKVFSGASSLISATSTDVAVGLQG